MRDSITSGIVGFIFAIGLGISGMTQPSKVFGFLDVFGNWDPSLMFVMIGAIGVHFVVYRVVVKKKSPKGEITPALVIGSLVFGIGWGLGGYCPGPAVVSLASLAVRPFIFVLSMVAGMYLFQLWSKLRS